MKTIVSRILSVALALALLCSVGLADAAFNETGLPICNEEVTLTMMHINDYTKDSNATWFLDWIRRNMGINIVVDAYSQEAIVTQYALRMSSDDLPDLCWFAPGSTEYADYYLDFKPYMDAGLMPNLIAWFELHPDAAALSTEADGAVRKLGNVRTDAVSRLVRTAYINTEWLKNVSMEMPTTVDELYDVLVAFRDEDADGDGDPSNEIPMSYTLGSSRVGERFDWHMLGSFGIDTCYMEYILQADEDGKVYLAETTDNYKAYLTYMAKLFSEGLLDNDLYSTTDAEFSEKMNSRRIGVWGSWNVLPTLDGTDEERIEAAGIYDFFPVMKSDYNDTQEIVLWNAANPPSYLASAHTEYPEIVARFMDFWLTEEGAIIYNYGVEGETFDYVVKPSGLKDADFTTYAEAKGMSLSDYQTQYLRPSNFVTWFVYSPTNYAMDQLAISGDRAALENYAQFADSAVAAKNALAVMDYGTVSGYPSVVYDAGMTEKLATFKTDIQNYIKTMKCQFITGELDIEDNWDDFQDTLKAMNLDLVIEVEQEAYDAYMGK